MIEKPGSMAVQSLVLNYVMTRGYHDSSAAEHQQSSWSDEEDERYKHREGTFFFYYRFDYRTFLLQFR